MPTYNYRLTGRDIKTLSPVESTDRVLLWGADSIHCSYPGCRFEICAVGGENVMGGAMQEGWGVRSFTEGNYIPPDAPVTEISGVKVVDISKLSPDEIHCTSPWRCAIHLTDDHKPITPEMIAAHCPGPPSPEYQRGHADGFEQAQRAIKTRPAMMPRAGGVDIPTPEEITIAMQTRGGLQGIGPLMTQCTMQFLTSDTAKQLVSTLKDSFGATEVATQTLFVIGMLMASLYFNDKYADQIEAANNPPSAVQ